MNDPQYLIVKLEGIEELVIVADPLETDIPPDSGTGIFNVISTPYSADSTGKTVTTTAFTSALHDAGLRGQGGQASIVYVPPGTYSIGNLILPSLTSLYLSPGSILRFTGNSADYRIDWFKSSQELNGTEWIRTAHDSHDIKIYGRGIIDVRGDYGQNEGRFIAHAVVPMATTRFTFDGPTIRDGGSWTIMPTRSSYVTIDHAKVLNRMDLGEVRSFVRVSFEWFITFSVP